MNFNEYSDTERYLNAATRGLWGRQRRALKTELRGHITARVQDFRLGGLSAAEAERQPLRERARAGERRHAGRAYSASAGQGGGADRPADDGPLTVFPQRLAQMNSQFLLSDDAQGPNDATSYLDFEQLRKELEKVGGTITGSLENLSLSLSGVSHSPIWLDVKSCPGSLFTRAGHQYLSTGAFFRGLNNTGAKIRLSGWNLVQVHVNQTLLSIQTGSDRRIGNSLYPDYLTIIPRGGLPPVLISELGKAELTDLTFKGNFKAGGVYTLVVPIFKSWWTVKDSVQKPGGPILLSVDTSAAQNGRLTLNKYIAADPYRFYSSVDAFMAALKPYLSPQSRISYWDASHPAPVLLDLTKTYDLNTAVVVPPASVKVAP